jgi:hypothetical protein
MKMPTHRLLMNWIITVSSFLVIHRPAMAEFMPPELVPVDRLIKSAEAQIAKNPADAKAQYTLARIHYLAFHVKHDHAPAFIRGNEGAEPAPQWMLGWVTNDKNMNGKGAIKLKEEEMIDHAQKALKGFSEALKLESKNGLYALGLASLMEEIATWKDEAKPAAMPDGLNNFTPAVLREAYVNAMMLALPADSKQKFQPVSGVQSLASYEAATALVRLAAKGELSEAGQKQVTEAKGVIAQLGALPMGPVTPIVFSMNRVAHLYELLDPNRAVNFDLRGYGWREQWTWVKPELGLLVWDPARTGRITSARQLFGGYTFQIFRDTGYDALAALDDNGDGLLSGSELDGISVWFDRNGDAKSLPDEVTPLRQLGVVSISVKAESFDGIHPMNARGITFQDGRVLPTWDWMVEPAHEKPERLASVNR